MCKIEYCRFKSMVLYYDEVMNQLQGTLRSALQDCDNLQVKIHIVKIANKMFLLQHLSRWKTNLKNNAFPKNSKVSVKKNYMLLFKTEFFLKILYCTVL